MKRLDYLTRRWWFFALLLLAQFVLVPYAGRNFEAERMNEIIRTTLTHSFQMRMGDCNLYFQIASLAMLLLLLVLRNRVKRLFGAWVALSYLLFALVQNMACTPEFGFSMVSVNVAMFLLVACAWAPEAIRPRNDYSMRGFRWSRSWMIPLALFAYWCPLRGNAFDFDPRLFLHGSSATSFCLTTPLLLTILTLNLPRVNLIAYRITALVGVIMGLYNMLSLLNPYTVNLGILHLPLLGISLYACVLSYRREAGAAAPPPAESGEERREAVTRSRI